MPVLPVIFGLSGLDLTPLEEELFLSQKFYGFILFSRNIASAEQLKNLTAKLKSLYSEDYEPKIFIDQEGGRVARLKPPVANKIYPSAEVFRNRYNDNKNSALADVKQNYHDLMLDLKRYGIDSPCAPVADLFYQNAHDIVGDRSFGSDVNMVEDLCSAAIDGIKTAGGIPVLKHIPGHGRSSCDSHLELPRVDSSFEDLNSTDFEIFRRLSRIAHCAMTAHIVFETLDPYNPVTTSKKAIQFIRNEIGFNGLLMTDDLCMNALHDGIPSELSVAKAAEASYEAGCDMMLHCNGHIGQMKALYKIFT